MNSHREINKASRSPTMWRFASRSGFISLMLFALGVFVVVMSEYHLKSEHFIKYSNTIVFVLFVFRILSQKYIEFAMTEDSIIFKDMTTIHQQKACAHFGTSLWVLFWMPVAIQLAIHIFEDIQRDQQVFFSKWGPYASVMLRFAILDQLIELILRQMDLSLHIHHYGEIIFSLIFLDFVPINQKSPGVYVFCLLNAFDRLAHPLFSLSSLVIQREKYIAHQNRHRRGDDDCDEENNPAEMEEYTPTGFDILIPTSETLTKLYWIIFWYYVVFLRLALTVLVTVFCVYQWRFLPNIWKALYPIMIVLFILVDVNVYLIFWKRSHLTKKREETVVKGTRDKSGV